MEILGVAKTAIEYLRDKIITGKLEPGSKVNEAKLAAELGISRPPLREAIRTLEEMQLVTYRPRRGCVVTGISPKLFRDLYEAREMIESYALELYERKSIKDLSAAEKALEVTEDLSPPATDDLREKLNYLNAFAAFHYHLVEGAGNAQLAYMYSRIGYNLSRYQFMYAYIPGLTRNSQEEHRKIVKMIKDGHYAEAKHFLRRHIQHFVELMESKIETVP